MQSLFDRLGGGAAVDAAVDRFYEKVMRDARISHFFEGVDLARQRSKQKAFLTMAFGGPNRYSGRSMQRAHVTLVERGLNDSHFDAVVENLGATLQELGVDAATIAEVAAIAETVRDDVLNRTPAGRR